MVESMNFVHKPVLLQESIGMLGLKTDGIYVDATVGLGGHSEKIWEQVKSGGKLVCLDADHRALQKAKQKLGIQKNLFFVNTNFVHIREVLKEIGIGSVDGILADLGVSSMELDDSDRGFSFRAEAPLDMRFSDEQTISAKDIVNEYSKERLKSIFVDYGDEKYASRIAQAIVQKREEKLIQTTLELVEIIKLCVPAAYRNGRIHPATRVFQALRMEVNDELFVLETFLNRCMQVLEKGGRLAVISFHSGEDRIVKNRFKDFESRSLIKIVTKKPITPTDEEIKSNPRSRSAKLRVAQKII
jgi:16S rRNA (cytosine1402-N4)-methyltransferase